MIKTVYLTYDFPYQTWNIVDKSDNSVLFFNKDVDVVEKWLKDQTNLIEENPSYE